MFAHIAHGSQHLPVKSRGRVPLAAGEDDCRLFDKFAVFADLSHFFLFRDVAFQCLEIILSRFVKRIAGLRDISQRVHQQTLGKEIA